MGSEYYESDSILAEYLFFHYGKSEDYLPYGMGPHDALDFPVRVVQKGLEGLSASLEGLRALDLGCAVGRSSFELSKTFQEVIGIDFSEAFIRSAQKIQSERVLTLRVAQEVGRTKEVEIELPQGIHSDRVEFRQGDALNLSPMLGKFDLILAANLIDRLPDPRRFLQGIGAFLNPKGALLLSSPYTWMESFTPPQNWLNQEDESFEVIQSILNPEFSLQKRMNLPMLIREHQRKYQWTVSELSVWIKN
ncbi:MAG: putative 4-mercaptohistidine N1-methyltransferase [Verrucomicrobiota bacterium]